MPDDAPADVVYLRPTQPPAQVERIALIGGVIAAVVLAGLVGWLGFRTYEAQDREAQRSLFVEAAQDVAVDLSTVDYQHADTDAQRIQDSAMGTFADSFAHHKQAYIDQAKQSRSRSLGTVTDVGLESQSGDQGRVLVAVTVKPADPTPAEQAPQFFRMLITMHKVGDGAKISDVAFVS
ncbi:MAG TPA: mammalian cell entry protein [Mycobacterium sp.]|nr:mammalian cell entry protein [Mycobacterium sp.]